MQFNQREAILLSLLCAVVILATGFSLMLKPQFKALGQSTTALAESTGAVKVLEAEQMQLTQEVGQAKTQYEENKTALSFTFENKDLESRMKGFMRVLSNLTTQTGNQLITIQPYGGALEDSASKTEKLKKDTEKPSELPEELQRFQAIKEQDLPLYSTKMELKIRGNFVEIKRFMEALASFNKELVQVETMYLSYEGLGERVMNQFDSQEAGGKKSHPARHLNRPLLLVTRLKFYLMEPNEQSFDQAVEELKAQTADNDDAAKESAT